MQSVQALDIGQLSSLGTAKLIPAGLLGKFQQLSINYKDLYNNDIRSFLYSSVFKNSPFLAIWVQKCFTQNPMFHPN